MRDQNTTLMIVRDGDDQAPFLPQQKKQDVSFFHPDGSPYEFGTPQESSPGDPGYQYINVFFETDDALGILAYLLMNNSTFPDGYKAYVFDSTDFGIVKSVGTGTPMLEYEIEPSIGDTYHSHQFLTNDGLRQYFGHRDWYIGNNGPRFPHNYVTQGETWTFRGLSGDRKDLGTGQRFVWHGDLVVIDVDSEADPFTIELPPGDIQDNASSKITIIRLDTNPIVVTLTGVVNGVSDPTVAAGVTTLYSREGDLYSYGEVAASTITGSFAGRLYELPANATLQGLADYLDLGNNYMTKQLTFDSIEDTGVSGVYNVWYQAHSYDLTLTGDATLTFAAGSGSMLKPFTIRVRGAHDLDFAGPTVVYLTPDGNPPTYDPDGTIYEVKQYGGTAYVSVFGNA